MEKLRLEIRKFLSEDEDIDSIIKKWGGSKGGSEELDPEDLFGDASIAALKDIGDEYGEDEIAPFGSMENPKKFVKDVTKKRLREDADGSYMTHQNLNLINDTTKMLIDRLPKDIQLDDWVEDKISKMAESIRHLRDYFENGEGAKKLK